jgi:Tfp pilus assembly protein PilE
MTLVELMIVMAMTVVIAGALSVAFAGAVSLQRSQEAMRAETDRSDVVERTITRLLTGARLATVGAATAPTTTTGTDAAPASTAVAASTTPITYFQGLSDGGAAELGSDRLTFTTTMPTVSVKAQQSQDDFETQQSDNGPIGGLAEVSLGMVAVGNPGTKTGLFERVQRPSDGDPTQGGQESVLGPDIASIGFQFWDGQEWLDTWDTTTMTPVRLPQAVQVTYRLKSEPNGPQHLFVVPIPTSDVTTINPVTSTTTSTTGTTSATGT